MSIRRHVKIRAEATGFAPAFWQYFRQRWLKKKQGRLWGARKSPSPNSATPMLIDSIAFTAQSNLRDIVGDHVFRYCVFEDADLVDFGIVNIEGAFLNCAFKNVEMYYMFLNGAVFIDCTFVACAFLGATFASCRVVECIFTDCVFAEDNMGTACSFNGTVWYGSTQNGCTGLSEALVPFGV